MRPDQPKKKIKMGRPQANRAILIALAAVQTQVSLSFSNPPSLLARTTHVPSIRNPVAPICAEIDPSDEAPQPSDETPAPLSAPAPPRAAPQRRRLDPLVASVTRNDDPESSNARVVNAPLLGEIPLDGSIVVLVPAAVIAVVGLLMSVGVALNSQDAIVSSLNELSETAAATAVAKTNVVPEDGVCRGICSSQDDDLDGLRAFMTSLSNKKVQDLAASGVE